MYNTISRTLYEEVKEEGLHSGPPGFKFIIFPAVFRTISYDSLYCLNKDGVVVTLSIAFQYKVSFTVVSDDKLRKVCSQASRFQSLIIAPSVFKELQ